MSHFSSAAVFKSFACLLVLLPGATLAAAPRAPSNALQYQRVVFTASVGRTSFDTLLRRDSAPGVLGTPLVAEDELGLAKSKLTGTAELTLRVVGRHRFRVGADYLSMGRSGSAPLTRAVVYDGTTYQATDTLQTALDLRRFSATYLYSPIRNERFELSAGVGVDLIDFRAEVGSAARGLGSRDDGSAPVPRLAVEGLWRISEHWYVEGRAAYLRGVIQDANGTIRGYSGNVVWAWQPGMAFTLGYQRYQLEAESRFTGTSGRVEFKTGGPQLAVRVGF